MSVRSRLVQLATTAALGAGETFVDLVKAAAQDDQGDGGADGEESNQTAPGGRSEDTAANAPLPDKPSDNDPKALFWDPYSLIEALGYRDKPSQMTYQMLRAMVFKMPIVQAIVKLRLDQIGNFCSPQHDRYRMGYRVKLREASKEPTKIEREWAQQAEVLIARTGITENPRGRDDFKTFAKKLMRDSLTFDQACFEVVPDRMGRPCEFYAVDGSTMRLADSTKLRFDEDEKAIRYVQVYDNMVVAEYNAEELCWGVRNPSTDIRLAGYGVAEPEMLVTTVTALLYGFEYNTKFFTQGSAAKGILNFKGTISEKALKAFRRHWYSLLTGVSNSWRTPITNAEDLQWVNLQQSSKDMEFSAWMDFLIKVACSIYSTDPVEVNFQYGNSGQKSALAQASNREKIQESRERGLRPLLDHLALWLNKHILWPINENFEVEFVGLDAMTRDQMADYNQKRVKTIMTVDELRAEDDLPPLPEGKGEVILDPTCLQHAQAKDNPQMGAEGGDMGEGEPDGGDGQGGDEFDEDQWAAMLGEDEDEGDEGEGDGEAAKPAKPAQPVEKSLVRIRAVV